MKFPTDHNDILIWSLEATFITTCDLFTFLRDQSNWPEFSYQQFTEALQHGRDSGFIGTEEGRSSDCRACKAALGTAPLDPEPWRSIRHDGVCLTIAGYDRLREIRQ
ncbi:MAG: hypothetical protein GY906_10365 [bacterium]|nr:hypothetical protein [bacterium]